MHVLGKKKKKRKSFPKVVGYITVMTKLTGKSLAYSKRHD